MTMYAGNTDSTRVELSQNSGSGMGDSVLFSQASHQLHSTENFPSPRAPRLSMDTSVHGFSRSASPMTSNLNHTISPAYHGNLGHYNVSDMIESAGSPLPSPAIPFNGYTPNFPRNSHPRRIVCHSAVPRISLSLIPLNHFRIHLHHLDRLSIQADHPPSNCPGTILCNNYERR